MILNTGRDKFVYFKPFINLLVALFGIFGKKFNLLLLDFSRNFRGIIGIVLRYIFLSNCAKSIGSNVSIRPGVYIFNPSNLVIGDNVSIHPMCYIEAAGGIDIGDNVSIAHSSTLISSTHTYNDFSEPIKYNVEVLKPIVIENDVWIGCGVRILSGVTIRFRCIVAAGAVVNKNFASGLILGGVPARVIKDINEK